MTPAGSRLVNIPERVRTVVARELTQDIREPNDADRLTVELHADSLDVIEVVMGLEREFDLTISDEDAEKFERYTVGQVIAYVEGRIR